MRLNSLYNQLFDSTTELPPDNRISAQELADRLRVSRHYVTKNIQPHIRSYRGENSSVTSIYFDKKELCHWLMHNATFSRQTWRFKEGSPLPKKGSYNPPLVPYQRNKVIAVPVLPFDFLDLPLIFPKEYHRPDSDKVTSAEICYRDMFKAGAIKIQLGSKKTMFYIPELDSNDPEAILEWGEQPTGDLAHPLLPAMWLPAAHYTDRTKIFLSEFPESRHLIGRYRDNRYNPPGAFGYRPRRGCPQDHYVRQDPMMGLNDSSLYDEDATAQSPVAHNIAPLDAIKSRYGLTDTVPEQDGLPYLEDDDSLDDLIEHAERYMPLSRIDSTPPKPIDDDPESKESIEDLLYRADLYFQPGDDIEYYDPHHDWYVKNWEGEDIPSTFSLNDEDDKTDK